MALPGDVKRSAMSVVQKELPCSLGHGPAVGMFIYHCAGEM